MMTSIKSNLFHSNFDSYLFDLWQEQTLLLSYNITIGQNLKKKRESYNQQNISTNTIFNVDAPFPLNGIQGYTAGYSLLELVKSCSVF